jgi:hypothetical protein
LQLDRVCAIPAKTPDEVMAATWARVEKSMLSRLWKKDANFHMLCLHPAQILAPCMIGYLTDHLLDPEPHMPFPDQVPGWIASCMVTTRPPQRRQGRKAVKAMVMSISRPLSAGT